MKINLENKKHLVTSGCSFTEGHMIGKIGSWAYHLSEMLGLKLYNKASGGQGNEWICDSIISHLINQETMEDVVVGVAWSEMTRITSSVPLDEDDLSHHTPTKRVDTVRPFDFDKGGKFYKYKCAEEFFYDIPWCAYRTYMSIIKLTYFLKANNIPYFFIDAINPSKLIFHERNEFGEYEEGSLHSRLFHLDSNEHLAIGPDLEFDLNKHEHQFKSILNKNINSRFFNKFLNIGDKKSIQDYLWKNDGNDYERLTKNNGGHPNEIASKEVAEIIYKQIT
jgi:hypothetical protein